ncbi:MAG: hypothetical protein FWG88_11770 [Oscillospiraceae bacterium]|nr:hypothetical protein [Oscillospiraceae bacterium]
MNIDLVLVETNVASESGIQSDVALRRNYTSNITKIGTAAYYSPQNSIQRYRHLRRIDMPPLALNSKSNKNKLTMQRMLSDNKVSVQPLK